MRKTIMYYEYVHSWDKLSVKFLQVKEPFLVK